MNITITGNLGSGKSSVCKELEKSGFTIISAGDIFREIAAEKGMTVLELNEAAKKDRSIDDLLDQRSTKLGKEMDHTVFDSRLAWHFVENSFKVFLLVDTQEAARRVFAGADRSAESYQDMEKARAGLETRAKLEQERFRQLYGIDYYDVCNYDLIIESSCASPDQIAQEIQRNFELYQRQPFPTKLELNLRCLHPSVPFDQIGQIQQSHPFNQIKQQEFDRQGRPESGNGQTLCAEGSFLVTQKDGAFYLVEHGEHEKAFAAAGAGKVFAQIREIRTDENAQKQIQQLPQSEIVKFAQAGGFDGWQQESGQAGYMADFSKMF